MKQLDGRQLLAMQGEAPLLLDVREPWELQTASVAPAGFTLVAIPMNEIPGRLAELDDAGARAQPVVCICHHGMRSAQVVAFLERQGYDDVYNLAGGVDAWAAQVDASVPRY